MIKRLNFNTKSQPVFITSDTHFCHERDFVWAARGYRSVQEHDDGLIDEWNAVVPKNGAVIHLGDFMLNGSAEKCIEYANRLNGHIYYVWGNHNGFIKQLYQQALMEQFGTLDIEVYPLTWKNKITFVGSTVHGVIDGQMYCASHFAHRVWDNIGKGAIFLSGHSHSKDVESNPAFQLHKRLDCGVDNFVHPLPWGDIMEIMKGKSIIEVDHHNSKTVAGF